MMKEIKEKNTADLAKLLMEKQGELRTLRFGGAGSGMRNTRAIRTIRRNIARIQTELTSRNSVAGNV